MVDEDDRLNLSLEELIHRNANTNNSKNGNINHRSKNRNNDNSTGLKYRGRSGGSCSSNHRADRSSKPYDDSRQHKNHRSHDIDIKHHVSRQTSTTTTAYDNRHHHHNKTSSHTNDETHTMNETNNDSTNDNTNTMSIMFLVSNPVAGLIIGRGGDRIRKFSAITQTVINISHHDDLYPGTLFRYVKIQGTLEALCLTLSILWEIVALEEVENSLTSRNIWNPTDRMSHQFDHVKVEGKLIVPAKTVGSIIGKDMSTIKSLVDTTHATVHFAKRYEPSLPGHSDRILTIAGETMNCVAASAMIVEKVFKWFMEGRGSNSVNTPDTARSNHSYHSSGSSSHEVHYQPSRSHMPLPPHPLSLAHSVRPWAVAGKATESPRSLTVVSSSHSSARSRSDSRGAGSINKHHDDEYDDDDESGNMDENEYDDDDDEDDNNNNTANNYYDGHCYDDYNDNNFSTSSSSNYYAKNANHNSNRHMSRVVMDPAHECESHSVAPRRKSHSSTISSDSGGSGGVDRGRNNHSQSNNRAANKNRQRSNNDISDHNMSSSISGIGQQTAAIVSASTTVSLAVANTAMGNLFGLKSAVLYELRKWSGADIVIAPRNDPIPASAGSFSSSHTHRLVTVQGEPAAVAEACRLITALLEGGSNSDGSVPDFSKL